MVRTGKRFALLSGVALMGLVGLSIFASQAVAETTVYSVPARFTTHTAGQYSSLTQYFRMTCDSVLSVSFFNGWYPGQGTFWAELRDSASGALAWSGSRNTADSLKYKDVGFTVNTAVTRGKTYKLIVGYTYGFGGTDYHLDVYYDSTNTYPYGYMYPYYGNVDLCAKVAGVNRIPQTFWGVNTEIAGVTIRDNVLSQLAGAGFTLCREQVWWWYIQPDDSGPNCYKWSLTDSTVGATNGQGMTLLFNIIGSPNWASSNPNPDSGIEKIHSAPPRNLDSLYDSGNNYFYNLMCSLATRYKNWGVHDWEIYNEVNYLGGWGWWDTTYYRPASYPRTQEGRVKLYAKACKVARDAIKTSGIDPGAKIYTNAVLTINEGGDPDRSGKWWLREFLSPTNRGQDYTDVISYHFYHPWWDTAYAHRFSPSKFQRDYDTVRAVLAEKSVDKPVWADEGGWGTPNPPLNANPAKMNREKQADAEVQVYNTGIGQLTNPRGPLGNVSWFLSFDKYKPDSASSDTAWYKWAGVWKNYLQWSPDSGLWYKPSGWAYKQMTGKLKDKYFNRRVPLQDTNVYAYEFQVPGADTMLKTWCLWRSEGKEAETLAIRTNMAYLYTRDTCAVADSVPVYPFQDGSGKVELVETRMDTVPRYLREIGQIRRPDVIVDSLWLVKASGTGEPRAGDGVRFYARIKNISTTDSVRANILNQVKFQVDGATKATYSALEGLGPNGDTITVGYLPPNSTNGGGGWDRDWTANWGDHLIRAWADSADRYVELREDNNQGYIFKHIRPKVTLIINNNSKYSNHLSNNTVSVVINGNTTPNPDSTYFRHESGSWTKIGHVTSFDTLVTYSGNGVFSDSVLIFQGADTALAGDSIIVDVNAPYTAITSPPDSQVVCLNAPVEFWGFSYDYENHDSVWDIWEDCSPWASGTGKVGTLDMGWNPGYFDTWTSYGVGWHGHSLVTNDSATNTDTAAVHVYVTDPTGDGDGFASGFGTFGSSPMNLATDPKGNLYIAVAQENKIRKHSPKKDSLFAFSTRRGNDSSTVTWPMGMVLVDSNVLWIADGLNHCLKQFDRQGNLLKRFGSFGSDSAGKFKQPSGIALDHKGRLFIVDRGNNRIQVYDTTGAYLFGFGGLGSDSGKLNSPTGIAITKDRLVYITDTKNHQVQIFDSLGNWKKTIKHPDPLGFDTPTGICTDKHGNVFIADMKHHRIVELNPFGRRLFIFGSQGDSLCQFKNPIGVAASPGAHFLYVADAGNKRVTRFWVIREDTLGGGGPQAGAVVQVLPLVYDLGPAIPNPSKGQTTFRYALPKESRVNFTIYNVTGQVVKEFNQGKEKAGYYSITWDGRSNLGHRIGAGVYFYRLTAGSWVKTRKMVVIR